MRARILLCAALFAACGKSSAGSSAASSGASGAAASGASGAAAADGPQDRCEVHVAGDLKTDYVASQPRARGPRPGKLTATTDYWMSDDEMRMALHVMASMGDKKSDAEIDAKVDDAMKKDPRMFLLMIGCSDADNHMSFAPSRESHYADVPYGPKKYAIAPRGSAPGDMTMTMHLKQGGGFQVAEPGTLEIKKFDGTGIAGTFHFVARTFKGDQTITVDGNFDYGCRGGSKCH